MFIVCEITRKTWHLGAGTENQYSPISIPPMCATAVGWQQQERDTSSEHVVISQIVAEPHSFCTADIPSTSTETWLIPAGQKKTHRGINRRHPGESSDYLPWFQSGTVYFVTCLKDSWATRTRQRSLERQTHHNKTEWFIHGHTE